MKKQKTALFILFSLLSITFTNPIFAVEEEPETILEKGVSADVFKGIPVPVDLKEWKVAYRVGLTSGQTLIEYLPKNEDLATWKEMVRSQMLPAGVSAVRYNEVFEKLMKEIPTVEYKVLESSDKNVLYEWTMSKANGDNPPQHEIGRFVVSKGGIYNVAYIKKVPKLDEKERALWIKTISDAKAP